MPAASAGPHLPDRHHQRVVPGADAADDPDRLAPDHRRVALDVLAGRLALEVAGGAGEEAEVVGRERHLVARGHERLADVHRLELRELLGVLVHHVGELVEELRALLRRLLEPLRRGGLRRLDRAVDVLGAAARHLGDRLAGRGRDHLHRLAGGRVGELAADQDLVLRCGGAHVSSLAHTAGISAASTASVTCAEPRRMTPVSRITRCASATGITVMTMTAKATTLMTGSCCPCRMLSRMKIGSVCCAPAVKRRHDDLVEGEREGEQAARDERRREDGPENEAEGLPAVGAEILRRLDQRGRRAAQPRDDVVVDDDDAEGRVADHDRPDRGQDPGEAEERDERHPGDDPGQSERQHEQERDRLPAEEAVAGHGCGGHRPEHERDNRRDGCNLQRELECAANVRVVPGDAEPVGGPVRDRPALQGRAVERVERDDNERDPEEGDHERRPDRERDTGAAGGHSASNAPSRRAISR